MFDKENFKLSILIPCYNEVSSIDLIINKVLKNLEFYNFSNYEIVIVDDFSNDGTKKKLEMFCDIMSYERAGGLKEFDFV